MVYNQSLFDFQSREIGRQFFITDDIALVQYVSKRDIERSHFSNSLYTRTNKDKRKTSIIITLILSGAVITSFILLPDSLKFGSLLFACPILTQLRKIFTK